MVESEEYNGWCNRETWACNLWLSNDQGMYNAVRERIAESDDAAAAVQEFTEEILGDGSLDQDTERAMARDIGSLWRVDWREIASAFGEE